jgi:hypothetical protein
MKKSICPNCGSRLQWKASADSDDRINYKWQYCEKAGCGWDERTAPSLTEHEVQEI